MSKLILILGDQLSFDISSLNGAEKNKDTILMAEVHAEATYVKHHKKKIAFIFSAMRHYCQALRDQGWSVRYTEYEDPENSESLKGEVERALTQGKFEQVVVTEPGEWRLLDDMETWGELLPVPVRIVEDSRFICSHKEFQSWASGRKDFRMEHFYREMRHKTGLLMDDRNPAGGKWNYDAENRKPLEDNLWIPEPLRHDPDDVTRQVLGLVENTFPEHFGDLEPFWFGVTHEAAHDALEQFISHCLPDFGDYQDAMLTDQRFLYHSVLSLYINAGLLDPLAVCKRVAEAYKKGGIPINAAEGFIRQIIGWREYVRGIYWLNMPGYESQNFFNTKRSLPDFYWTGDTELACLRSVITQTLEEAYAHHIQRLMVTGNFALLIGADPAEVHEWYLMVYADAYEWVELPNTLGMSQFADGGLLGTKPYAAGGNYINKMSDYCSSCRYDVNKKTGEGSCPFNSLYWHFIDCNRDKLSNNRRLAQVYATWDRMEKSRRKEYIDTADTFLRSLDE